MLTKIDSDITVEKKKIFFQYICVLLFSLVLGCAIANFVNNGLLLSFIEQIRIHFSAAFPKDKPLYNITITALCYSAPEIICIVCAFCFTFSIFNYLASDVIFFYEGINVGFSAVVLYRCIRIYEIVSISKLIWFVGFKIAFLIFILFYLYGLAVHSFELKEFTSVHRINIKIRPLLFILLYTVAGLGTTLLLNGIYCIVIFIL